MIKQALTVAEVKLYNVIWSEAWKEKGFDISKAETDLLTNDLTLIRHLFSDGEDFVATIGLRKLLYSKTKHFYSLETNSFLCENKEFIFEIDKLAIRKDARGLQILSCILSFLAHFSQKHEVRYFVALIEPKLFKSIKLFYKLPTEQIGDAFFFEGDTVIPVSIDVSKAMSNPEKFDWLQPVELVAMQ
jgi:hypothetical protein